jgi:hypothetical protein
VHFRIGNAIRFSTRWRQEPLQFAQTLSFALEMPRNGGVSFIRIWSPSPETCDGRGIPVSVSEADSLASLLSSVRQSGRPTSVVQKSGDCGQQLKRTAAAERVKRREFMTLLGGAAVSER